MNSLDEVRNALADNNVMITAYIEQLENEVGELRGSTAHLENKIKEGKLAYAVLKKEHDAYIDFMENKFLDEGRDIKNEYNSYKEIVKAELVVED